MSSSTFVCMYLCEVQAVVFLHSHVNNNVMIFLDVCQQCGHVIADHEYTFSVDDSIPGVHNFSINYAMI